MSRSEGGRTGDERLDRPGSRPSPTPPGPDDPAAAPAPGTPTRAAGARPSRRSLLTLSLGVAGGAAVGFGIRAVTTGSGAAAAVPVAPADPTRAPVTATEQAVVPCFGANQAGIASPATPQAFGLVWIGDLTGTDPSAPDLGFLPAWSAEIAALTSGQRPEVLPDGPGSLTVTIGLGPRLVSAVGPDGPGSESLPDFAGDELIDPTQRDGDVLIGVYSADPTVVEPVVHRLLDLAPGLRPRWSQRGFRGPGTGTVVRNPLGFHDGIQVPHGDAELAENVWLDRPAGATICVVRRLVLQTDRFRELPLADRERIIGRRLDGSPLSGGEPLSPVDINAKAPNGALLVPARSHVRSAHPAFTGSALMLRRGYGYDNGSGDAGLLFVCFQRDLRTFVVTQRRLDANDDLMPFARPTGSATFLVLPGFTADRPLGASFGA